jgi:hypothetical protein
LLTTDNDFVLAAKHCDQSTHPLEIVSIPLDQLGVRAGARGLRIRASYRLVTSRNHAR